MALGSTSHDKSASRHQECCMARYSMHPGFIVFQTAFRDGLVVARLLYHLILAFTLSLFDSDATLSTMPTIRAPDQRVVLARRANARQSNSLDANLTDASDSHSPYSDDLASVSGSNYTATSSNDDTRNQNSSAVWDLDMPQQRSRGFDEFAEKQLLPEETALMIRKFERAADLRFSRTYQLGTAVRHNYSDSAAHSPHVGLVVLPGASKYLMFISKATGSSAPLPRRHTLNNPSFHEENPFPACEAPKTASPAPQYLQPATTKSHASAAPLLLASTSAFPSPPLGISYISTGCWTM